MPDEREKEADTGETPDGARVRTVNCPACTVAYDASLDSCPRCGAPVPGRPPKTVFPMEVGRFPRPWKAFPAAYDLLLHPRRSWPSISPKGKNLHAVVFCLTWALSTIVGSPFVFSVIGDLPDVPPDYPRVRLAVLLFLMALGTMVALQVAVFVVVRLTCMLCWIRGSKANASAYAAGLIGLSLAFAFVLLLLSPTHDRYIPQQLVLFGVLEVNWVLAEFVFLFTLPSALLLGYLLFGFYRWRVGLGRRSTLLLSVVPPSVFMLAVCFYFAQPRILR